MGMMSKEYHEGYQQGFKDAKADYENRLKADMAAMLTDLQLNIEGQKFDTHIDKDVWNDAIGVCSELIQERINKLEENEDMC